MVGNLVLVSHANLFLVRITISLVLKGDSVTSRHPFQGFRFVKRATPCGVEACGIRDVIASLPVRGLSGAPVGQWLHTLFEKL